MLFYLHRLFGPCSRSELEPRGVASAQRLSECGARTGAQGRTLNRKKGGFEWILKRRKVE